MSPTLFLSFTPLPPLPLSLCLSYPPSLSLSLTLILSLSLPFSGRFLAYVSPAQGSRPARTHPSDWRNRSGYYNKGHNNHNYIPEPDEFQYYPTQLSTHKTSSSVRYNKDWSLLQPRDAMLEKYELI